MNAGGGTVPSVDNGPDWVADSPYVNTGNSAGWSAVPTVNATVPASTPRAVFSSERWDDGGDPEMQYNFPVTAGKQVEVRLYLANRYGGTASVGQRVFDVQLEGTTRLDDYDIVADVGHDVGTMKSYSIVSDGNVDIDFFTSSRTRLSTRSRSSTQACRNPTRPFSTRRHVDPSMVTPRDLRRHSRPAPPWASVRGAFFADGRLWNAWSDGTWTTRPYNGSSFGGPTALELYGLGAAAQEAQTMTGLFMSPVGFTLAGDPTLHYRYLSVDSGMIGAERFDASGSVSGMSFADVQGMFIADGGLYWVDKNDGALHRLNWSNGVPSGPDQIVSDPAQDGVDWRSRALFTYSAMPANQVPVASFTSACSGATCTFDGRGSSDGDGTIVSYAWDFGDGASGTGATTTHTYGPGQGFTVRLTVTDDDGATGSTTQTVTPGNAVPNAAFSVSCQQLACSFDGSASSDSDGSIAAFAWNFGDGQSAAGPTTTHAYAGAGHTATLTEASPIEAGRVQPVSRYRCLLRRPLPSFSLALRWILMPRRRMPMA